MNKVQASLHVFFSGNAKSKLIAFTLALLVWFHGKSEISFHIKERVPIKIEGNSPHLMTHLHADEAIVTLSGPRENLTRFFLKLKSASYPINSLSLPAGQDSAEITIPVVDFLNCPRGINFVSSTPDVVKLTLVSSQSKLLEIQPKIVGESSLGYQLIDAQSIPSLILVKGPKKILSRKRFIETELIHLPKLEREGTLAIPARLEHRIDNAEIEFYTSREIMIHIKIGRAPSILKNTKIESNSESE